MSQILCSKQRLVNLGLMLCLLMVSLLPPFRPTRVNAQASSETVYAVTGANRLIRFNSTTPGDLTASYAITGLQPDEDILGIDFRPATGQLYALGSANRLYTLDLQTGAATLVGTQPFTTSLTGAGFGFDFNPVPDRIRVVSDAEQNVRLHPDTGAVAGIDTTLAFTNTDVHYGDIPNIVAAAYSNNISGTTTTTLYVIDASFDLLARQGGPNGDPSPNTGQLFSIGYLGFDTSRLVGFDISPSGVAYAALTPPAGTSSDFYTIDLTTGSATRIDTIGGGQKIVGLAIPTQPPPPPPPAETVYAVTSANRLIQFNSANPGALTGSQLISGLPSGETILGIDFRPATGQLYALGSTNRTYTINLQTGAATMVGAQPFTTPLTGAAFGFDFNPVPDRIRVVSDAEQNLRLHPDTGAVAGIDTTLAYTSTDVNYGLNPTIVAAAYTDNISGTTTTTLYVIDANLDILARQGGLNGDPSPNGGKLFTVGPLGVDSSLLVGFDISQSGTAYTSITLPGGSSSSLATVNLTTGAVTSIGMIGGPEKVIGLAVPTVPPSPPPPPPPPPSETVLVLTNGNRLIQFNSTTPGIPMAALIITGLQPGEIIQGIDFRPATGQLYALGSTSRLYTINLETGGATLVGTQPFTPPLNGTSFGFDFNPVPDRIRVVSDAGQNLRLHPDTGAIAGVDTTLAYTNTDVNAGVNPAITAAAYSNNISGATTTTLYVMDTALDILARQGGPDGNPSPNTGQLFTVGPLGVNATNFAGFDISPSGAAYAVLTVPPATTSFFTVNRATGQATLVGGIAGLLSRAKAAETEQVVDLVIQPSTPPSSTRFQQYLPVLIR